jgi:kinesin family protein C2/C3
LRLAQAEAAKQTAVEELEKSRGDARSELDKEQLKAEAELKIALADSEALRTKLGEVGPSREELNEARARAKDFRDRYMNERKLRRKLTDELAELKGNIRVVARCRPAAGNGVVEFPSGAEGALEVVNDHGLTQRFEFDRVFRPGSSQSDIFDHVAPVIQGCFDGIHACIFAYGQTGSGKTHTMEGPPSDRGVYFRALSELFHGKPADTELCVKLSMLEIYNETLIDLLTDKRCKLEVKRCSDGTHEVQGLTTQPVASLEEVHRHVESGSKRRQTGAHDLNDRSSRSHLILSLDVECKRKDEVLTSRLNLVDLAGSERLSRTGATGDRLKEAQAINKSLSSLGDVVNALAKKTQCHVPYRNSKLTYLLQDSLSRAARVLMVVNISPLEADASETICSLAFAARCRDVELGAALARPEAAELMRAKQEIRALRARLDRLALAAK